MGKEEIKLSLFIDDMIVYVEDLKDSTKNSWNQLLSNQSKVAGAQINVQKSIIFLYTSNEQTEFEIKFQIYLISFSVQNMKYLGINVTKYAQDLHEENCKILMNKIKEKLNSVCSWMGRLNIAVVSILLNLIGKCNAIPIKIPASYFVIINTLILKCI